MITILDNQAYKTIPVNLELNVRERLNQLDQWRKEFDAEDLILEQKAKSLDLSDKRDAQIGKQIANQRRILRQKLAQHPLEVHTEDIQNIGFEKLRLNLVIQFTELSVDERLLWLRNLLFIMTPDLRELIQKIDRVISFSALGQRRCFLLGGKSGMGKTTFLDWYMFHSRPSVGEISNIIRVLKVNAPVNNLSGRHFYRRIINAAGMTYSPRDDEEELLDKVIMIFENCHVELFIVDEVEHMRSHELRRKLLEVSNLTSGIPIVCASCNPIRWAEGDDEIKGRWNDFYELQPFTGERLSQLLAYLELLLPFPNLSRLSIMNITDPKTGISRNIFEILTKGILRDIMVLLLDASEKAIQQNQPNLTIDLLRNTWKGIQSDSIVND